MERQIKAKPTKEMLEWADLEMGLFFHFDIEVFKPEFNYRNGTDLPPVSLWKPTKLNTDQWLATAKAAGAKYALLTTKHTSGFCLWPTKYHDYHVGNAPINRDVVGEFVASCRKYGIKPALYYSLNSIHLELLCRREDGTQDLEKKNAILLGQVEELITNYGPLSEIWFDGGVLRKELGGPDIPGLLNRIAPDLICFGGCPGLKNIVRWSGSEQGVARQECWSAAHFLTGPERRNVTCDSPGDPFDEVWAPVEVDMPVRDVFHAYMGGWMYHKDDADKTYSAEYMFERYLTSVGRNANLTISCLPTPEGIISPDQIETFRGLGQLITERLSIPAGQTEEMIDGDRMEIWLDHPIDLGYVELCEDQTDGQRILSYVVETRWPEYWCELESLDNWIPIAEGKSIGHKRIIPIRHLNGYAFRVRILDKVEGAKLKSMRVFGERCGFEPDPETIH